MPFEMKKVFDCQDMPIELRKKFFESYELHNNSYVEIDIHSDGKAVEILGKRKNKFPINLESITDKKILYDWTDDGVRYLIQEEDFPVDDWLLQNGAVKNEKVIVEYWW